VLLCDGAEFESSVVLIDNAKLQSITDVIGSVRGIVREPGRLVGRVYFVSTDAGRHAMTLVREGHLEHFSVIYEPLDWALVPGGQTKDVGGRSFTAKTARPLYVIRKWRLRAVSCRSIAHDTAARVIRSAPVRSGPI
jgi:hypothetical protein